MPHADNRVIIEVRKHFGDKTKKELFYVTEELLESVDSKNILVALLGTKVLEGIENVRS